MEEEIIQILKHPSFKPYKEEAKDQEPEPVDFTNVVSVLRNVTLTEAAQRRMLEVWPIKLTKKGLPNMTIKVNREIFFGAKTRDGKLLLSND